MPAVLENKNKAIDVTGTQWNDVITKFLWWRYVNVAKANNDTAELRHDIESNNFLPQQSTTIVATKAPITWFNEIIIADIIGSASVPVSAKIAVEYMFTGKIPLNMARAHMNSPTNNPFNVLPDTNCLNKKLRVL